MADQDDTAAPRAPVRGIGFRLVIMALCLSIFLGGIDLTSVSTALPTIVHDLQGQTSFAWTSSAYTLASAAVLPMVGQVSEIFGRRNVLMTAILFFAVGSLVCATSRTIETLITGRALQGVGNGGIQVSSSIIIADLTTLRERGVYTALIAMTYTVSSMIGPFLSGAIVESTTWRWLFYLNLPLCAIAFVSVTLFLRLKKPEIASTADAILALDWIGNGMLIASTVSCVIALTWAGGMYAWTSARVLVPLICGLLGLAISLAYEARIAHKPAIPITIISNRTSLSAYLQSFIHGMVVMVAGFYLPVYLQSAHALRPLASAVYILPIAGLISPTAIAQGLLVSKTGRYWLIHLVGWSFGILGFGLLATLNSTTHMGIFVAFMPILAVCFGSLYATSFSALAALSVTSNSAALSFLTFMRTFSQSWAVAIGATVLQTQLDQRLPADFVAMLPSSGGDIAYKAIPLIRQLPLPLQLEVRRAFADALRVLWWIMLGFAGAGWLLVLLMRELPLHTQRDERWGLEERASKENVLVSDDIKQDAQSALPEATSAIELEVL